MAARYVVTSVDMGTGEWVPLLVDNSTGLGLFEPTAYALSLRSKKLAVNTIIRALGAVAFLYETLAEAEVDLVARARRNELLNLGEVEGLVARCKYWKAELRFADKVANSTNVSSLRKALQKSRAAQYDVAVVKSDTTAGRLYYIAQYLEWFADYITLAGLAQNQEEFGRIAALVVSAIQKRTPNSSSSSKSKKKGLTKERERRLFSIVDPESAENPWKEPFLRSRNYVIVRLLRDFGIRKGELLGLKVGDINFSDSTIFIARRPDDKDDPRPRQPQAKTLERILPMGNELADILKRYLSEDRFQAGEARKHPFLIVADDGAPLALNSVDFIFTTLREKFPELAPLSAHILRHTWNDAFSVFAKSTMAKGMIEKTRNYLMGWTDNSKMAANYTARFVEEQGQDALLQMQNALYMKGNK